MKLEMDFLHEAHLKRVLPLKAFRRYGHKKLECLTGFISEKEARWEAHTNKHLIVLKYFSHTIVAGIGESEIEAHNDSMVIGGVSFLSQITVPTTVQIIEFMKWKISEDQILEFSEH
jgi:hypothetical protein